MKRIISAILIFSLITSATNISFAEERFSIFKNSEIVNSSIKFEEINPLIFLTDIISEQAGDLAFRQYR